MRGDLTHQQTQRFMKDKPLMKVVILSHRALGRFVIQQSLINMGITAHIGSPWNMAGEIGVVIEGKEK